MKAIKLLLVCLVCGVSSSFAQQNPGAGKNNHYFVQSPHSQEQCMKAMDEMKAHGDQYLSKFYFGCMSGDHTAYAVLDAPSEDAARKMLPQDLQQNAKITKVDKFSSAQIEKMHKNMH